MARRWLAPGEFKELVQIGAVKLDADSFASLAEFDMLVKPRVNSVLSPYFEKLTGITNEKIEQFSGGTFRPRAIYDNGRQYYAGVRFKF